MANFFSYGTTTATGTVPSATETVVLALPIPDNREPIGQGVNVYGVLNLTSTSAATATIRVRQRIGSDSAGTSTAGSLIGSIQCQLAVVAPGTSFSYSQFDQTGTFPLTGYVVTAVVTSAIATINSATLFAQATGE